jgi:hypothetical protein
MVWKRRIYTTGHTALPSVTLGKKVSVNCTSATTFLLNTFYRSLDKDFAERRLVLGKKICRRGVRWWWWSLCRELSWHSAKAHSLLSAFCTGTWQKSSTWPLCQFLYRVYEEALDKGCFSAKCSSHNTPQRSFTVPRCVFFVEWYGLVTRQLRSVPSVLLRRE